MPMSHTRPLLLTSILLGATAGCGDAPETPGWTQIDSAGVTIVSGPLPRAPIGIVTPEPLFAFEVVAGTPIFRASDLLPREDGSFVVLDGGNHRVLLFDAAGELLGQAGHQGDGPGEFQAPTLAARSGDSILVYDSRHRRVTVFGPALELVRDRLLEGQDGATPPQFTGALLNGAWIGLTGQSYIGPPPSGVLRRPVHYIELDGDSGRVLATGKGSERWIHVVMDGGEVAAIDVVGYGFYRNTVAATSGPTLVVGDTDQWVISIHDSEGQVTHSLRVDEPARRFGDSELQQFLDGYTDDLPEERRAREESLANVTLPETLPTFSEIRADDQGRIWARQFSLDRTAAQRWIVLSDDGAVGIADMPRGFALRAIRADRLYGVFRDEFDVESIRVYRLE